MMKCIFKLGNDFCINIICDYFMESFYFIIMFYTTRIKMIIKIIIIIFITHFNNFHTI